MYNKKKSKTKLNFRFSESELYRSVCVGHFFRRSFSLSTFPHYIEHIYMRNTHHTTHFYVEK